MKLLTLARDLRRRKSREHQHLFTAEGVRAVEELLRSPLTVRGALVAPHLVHDARGEALLARLRAAGTQILEVTEPEFDSASDTDSPQGVLAIGEIPRLTLDTLELGGKARVVVLDAVQDPGNAGTIVRTAAALGASAAVALPGTVDLWNPKVVRSAMGASFRFPTLSGTWAELDAFRRRHEMPLWGADAGGAPLDASRTPARLALAVGNEGAGLSQDARQRADLLVALPIEGGVESLNVAVATGILLYQLRS